MNAVFADTSFYIASINERDVAHQAAVDFCRNYREAIVTSEYILVELGNFLSRTSNRSVFVSLV